MSLPFMSFCSCETHSYSVVYRMLCAMVRRVMTLTYVHETFVCVFFEVKAIEQYFHVEQFIML